MTAPATMHEVTARRITSWFGWRREESEWAGGEESVEGNAGDDVMPIYMLVVSLVGRA